MKTTHRICILLFIILISLIPAPVLRAKSFGDKQVDKLYNKVLEATFPSEKEEFTTALGRLGGDGAKNALLSLLDDSDSWNQEAAIIGCLLLNMPEVDRILVDRMLTEFMIDDDISEGIIANGERFIGILIQKYEKVTDEQEREILLETIARINNKNGEKFLRDIVKDKGLTDRVPAFQYLMEYFPVKKEYVTSFFNDPELKEFGLSWLVDNGERSDLPLFLKLIKDAKEDEKYKIIGYEAVNKWGDTGEKQSIYIETLQGRNEVLIRGALFIFGYLRNATIVAELCRLTKQASQQDIRLVAASTLADMNEKQAIPYLVSVLKETYAEEQDNTGIDILASIFTFGISAILEKLSGDMSKNEFNTRINDILTGLTRLTGLRDVYSYEEWLDWAVFHGYSVDGINIIQYLFSGYPEKRKKAIDDALSLLGFKSKNRYFAKYPGEKGKSDRKLAPGIAALLVEKGFLIDERF